MTKTRTLLVLFVIFCSSLSYLTWHAQNQTWRAAAVLLTFPMLSALCIFMLTFIRAAKNSDGTVLLDADHWLYRVLTFNRDLEAQSLCGKTWTGALALLLIALVLLLTGFLLYGIIVKDIYSLGIFFFIPIVGYIVYKSRKVLVSGWNKAADIVEATYCFAERNSPSVGRVIRRTGTSVGRIVAGSFLGFVPVFFFFLLPVVEMILNYGWPFWKASLVWCATVVGLVLAAISVVGIVIGSFKLLKKLNNIPAVQFFKQKFCPVLNTQ